jgi:uncharacterized protein YdiU (UPF0061 family)
VRRTAYLVAKWQAVGFVHGVLNTDNMSIMGLTIDYGPYGFMEHFDPQYVPNGSDNSARYSYQEQPKICKWNLGKLFIAHGCSKKQNQARQKVFITCRSFMFLTCAGKLAEVLAPLLPKGSAERILSEYDDIYAGYYESLMAGKFGFCTTVVATEGEAGKLCVVRRFGKCGCLVRLTDSHMKRRKTVVQATNLFRPDLVRGCRPRTSPW